MLGSGMSSIASRVAARFITSMDKGMALAIAQMVKAEISRTSGVDWDWDVRGLEKEDGSPGFGWSGNELSFPGKPDLFANGDVLGGLLVKGDLSVAPVPGTSNVIDLEVGYYHKLSAGGQEYTDVHDLGMYNFSIDANGVPTFDAGQDLSPISGGFEKLTKKTFADPNTPLSQSQSAIQRRSRKKLTEDVAKRKREEAEADRSTHGSVEAFAQYIKDDTGGTYGPPDIAKLLDVMIPNQAERIARRPAIVERLKELGCTFDRRKTKLSSSPSDVAGMLRSVASRIDASRAPSASAVARDILAVLGALEP